MGKKLNLKKKLAPYTIDDEYLKSQSKLLKSIVYPEDDDCELGNINEEPNYHPDDEPNDDYDEDYDDKDLFLDKHQQGY